MRYVIDASVAIRWFVKDFSHRNADYVLDVMVREPERFCVPELFLYEVYSVLHRHHPYANRVFANDVERILRSGVLRYPMTENIYTRANRFIQMGLTGYDTVYIALAEELDGKWLTFDSKAHALVQDEGLSIDLFSSSIKVEGLEK